MRDLLDRISHGDLLEKLAYQIYVFDYSFSVADVGCYNKVLWIIRDLEMSVMPPGGPRSPQNIPPSLPPAIEKLLEELEVDLENASRSWSTHPKEAREDFDQALKVVAQLQGRHNLPPRIGKLLNTIGPIITTFSAFVGTPGPEQQHVLDTVIQKIQDVIYTK